jgi:hypothetical protein
VKYLSNSSHLATKYIYFSSDSWTRLVWLGTRFLWVLAIFFSVILFFDPSNHGVCYPEERAASEEQSINSKTGEVCKETILKRKSKVAESTSNCGHPKRL